jgi:lipoyl(octanoyl) transferase
MHACFVELGRMPYAQALSWQILAHQYLTTDGVDPVLFCVEHPDVLTLGKHATEADLLVTHDSLQKEGVHFEQVDRGGKITAHMPGQIVMYPILPLALLKLSPRQYICRLESAMIKTLAAFSLQANRHPEYPGVWWEGKKIGAVGVRIKNRISLHGISLNVNNSLGLFHKIIPCGIKGGAVCNMAAALPSGIHVQEVKTLLIKELAAELQLPMYTYMDLEVWRERVYSGSSE